MPHLRSRFPAFYRFAALLALWAMLVPVAVTVLHHPVAAQGYLRICGSEQPAGNNPGKVPAHKMPDCPICQGMHLLGNGLTATNDAVVAEIHFNTVLYIPVERVFILKPLTVAQAQPRAPPSFA